MSSVGSVRRGVYFKGWLFGCLRKAAEDRNVSFSSLVQEACIHYLGDLPDVDFKRVKLLAERDCLLRENQELFIQTKRLLRDGAYILDAVRKVLLGDTENIIKFGRKKGLAHRIEQDELEVLLRLFKTRENNTRRLVEVLKELLPEDKISLQVFEKGWKIESVK